MQAQTKQHIVEYTRISIYKEEGEFKQSEGGGYDGLVPERSVSENNSQTEECSYTPAKLFQKFAKEGVETKVYVWFDGHFLETNDENLQSKTPKDRGQQWHNLFSDPRTARKGHQAAEIMPHIYVIHPDFIEGKPLDVSNEQAFRKSMGIGQHWSSQPLPRHNSNRSLCLYLIGGIALGVIGAKLCFGVSIPKILGNKVTKVANMVLGLWSGTERSF